MFRIAVLVILLIGGLMPTLTNLRAAEATERVDTKPVDTKPIKSEPVDFSRQIRPILAANCLACHGADEDSRQADLRLDRREDALAEHDGHRGIVPGNASASEFYRRITSTDADMRMPPPDSGHELKPAEIELLRRWIAEGAEYAQHWSFVKPVQAELPRVKWQDRVRNPIDAFILAKLEEQGLTPSVEADRYTLVRRVTLDLTGLPPTPAEVDAFVNDRAEDAYERLVDRLLNSQRYGEHWARMWLDLARYADTKGYEKDQPREIWRYRDWVIQALNADMPYDQFTVEQLAGDLLPNANVEQMLATAFHRNTMTNDEGGTDNEEFRVVAVKDRVDTTMQVWMGLTMGCAKCHSHKYDPITMREYYQFFDLFNQTEDADRYNDEPRVPSPTDEQQARQEQLKQQLADVRKQYRATSPEFLAALREWEQQIAQQVVWQSLQPEQATSAEGATLTPQADGAILASGTLAERDVYTLTVPAAAAPVKRITAIRLDALTDASLEKSGPGRNGRDPNFVINELTLHVLPGTDDTAKSDDAAGEPIALKNARADFSQGGWDVAGAIDNDPQTGWAIAPQVGKPHVAVFDLAEPLEVVDGTRLRFTISQQYGNSLLLGKFRVSVSEADVKELTPELAPPAELARVPVDQRTPDQQKTLDEAFRRVYPPTAAIHEALTALEQQWQELQKSIPRIPVMRELAADKRRTTRINLRGNFLDPGDEVQGDVPAAFGPLPAGLPRNRLGVAQWLMHADNPLTARVAVNRYWARFFGIGLVETEEDFGTQGLPPSHPELLDWLAVEFRDGMDWSLKQLCKTIVMSATYRQSSRMTPEGLTADPGNRMLSRGPRFRLSAETVRDQALAAAGLLSHKTLGPSVMPPQPSGIWQTTYSKLKWETSTGEDRFRRSLYTFWRRTSPYPSMLTFDAGSREVCLIRRVRTNTPLQALVTMNDPVYVEAAGGLAKLVLTECCPDAVSRAELAFRRVLGRPPRDAEVRRLVELYQTAREEFRQQPASASGLLEAANATVSSETPSAAEWAAWIVVANVLLNLDETVTRN